MSVIALGLNYHTAPIDLRGRVAFPTETVPSALRALAGQLRTPIQNATSQALGPEIALLSTCNRTELYAAVPEFMQATALVQPLTNWLATQAGISGEELLSHRYVLENTAAARHVFRVAAGLDSMVLGEPQILGQMKQAVREADNAGTLGSTLHQLFQRSFSIAKEVRTSTEIGLHSISMAAAAVRQATQLFGALNGLAVLFVGAGEMIELVATHFAARHPQRIAVANRTLERGAKLALRLGAQALRLADIPRCLHEFDIVISCTASTLPIIGLGAVERALKARRRRPMFMLDLAVPRDIEPEVGQQSDIYLYTLDDLGALVRGAGEKRQAAVEQAEAIIDAGVQGFSNWLDQRASVPLIQALTRQTDDWRSREIQRAHKALAKGEPVDTVLDSLARGLTQKMLHGTLAELRLSEGEQRHRLVETVSRLFLRQTAYNNADPDAEC